MFLLIAFFSLSHQITAVCFISQQETIPRNGLKFIQSPTLSSCKLECIRDSQCQSITYNASLKICAFHGDPIGQVCSNISPYTRFVKTLEGCSEPTPDEIVSNYVTDPCLSTATFTPEYTYTDQDGICPLYPVGGEAKSRSYVVSVILHDGTYSAYDNNAVNRLHWDATLNSYVIYLYYGSLLLNEPVYAAMCAYYPTEVSPECPCAPLSLESPGTTTPSVAPSPMCAGPLRYYQVATKNAQTYDTGSTCYLRCMAQQWIMFSPVGANGIQNSWIISAASCL